MLCIPFIMYSRHEALKVPSNNATPLILGVTPNYAFHMSDTHWTPTPVQHLYIVIVYVSLSMFHILDNSGETGVYVSMFHKSQCLELMFCKVRLASLNIKPTTD